MPKHQAHSARRRHLVTIVKLLFACGLVAGLFFYQVITLEALRATFRDPPVAALAFALLLLGYVLSAARWYFLLHAMGIQVRLRPCAEIFAMGTFANTFLPGGTGGDLVRAVYIARHVHQDRTGGVISVFADRAVGLLGVLGVAVLLGASDSRHVIASPLTRTFFLTLTAAFGGAVLGILLTFALLSQARFEKLQGWIGARTIAHRTVVRLFATAVQLRAHPMLSLLSFVVSVVITLTMAAAGVLLARGYEAGGLGPLDFANASVLALLANAVPLTPGGIGVAEGAFAFLCYAWEPTPTALAYGTIFFGERLILTLINLIGSVAFLTYRGTIARAWEPHSEGAVTAEPGR
jgi:uncharacterized protein (TIRG00374 family)